MSYHFAFFSLTVWVAVVSVAAAAAFLLMWWLRRRKSRRAAQGFPVQPAPPSPTRIPTP